MDASSSNRQDLPRPDDSLEGPRYAHGRSPAWRWQAAVEVAAGTVTLPENNRDEAVASAVEYLRTRDAEGRAQARCRHPDIAAAEALRQAYEPRRSEPQARLLAGQVPAEIAGHLGVAEAAVVRYEQLFFAVADRLDANDWIAQHAIGLGELPEPAQPPEGLVWRHAGWMHGPEILQLLIDDYHETPTDDPDARSTLADRLRLATATAYSLFGDMAGAAATIDAATQFEPGIIRKLSKRAPTLPAHCKIIRRLGSRGRRRR